MTVIATDGRTMAGDGRVTAGHTILADDFRKVRLMRDGSVMGVAGDMRDGMLAFDWVDRGAPMGVIPKFLPDEKPEDGFEALLLRPDGTIHWFDKTCVFIEYRPPWTIGCAADAAMVCLQIGMSPVEAVERAFRISHKCGGTITELAPIPPAPRKRLWQRLR